MLVRTNNTRPKYVHHDVNYAVAGLLVFSPQG